MKNEIESQATSPAAVRARVTDWCKWFDLAPVKVRVRLGEVYMTNEMLKWCRENSAPLDWIFLADAKAMAVTYCKSRHEERDLVKILDGFDDAEKQHLLECLNGHSDGGKPFEDALADFKAFVQARRSTQSQHSQN